MKNTVIILLLSVSIISKVFSQAPSTFNYQAVVRDANNNLKLNSEIGMRISILYSSVEGEVVYSETQHPVTNQHGMINVEIGGGQPILGNWPIDWEKGDYYLKTEFNLTAGDNSVYNFFETSKILSVPVAQYSKTSNSLTGEAWEISGIYTGTGIYLTESVDPNFIISDELLATVIYLGPTKIAININNRNLGLYNYLWAAKLGEKNTETGEIPFLKIYGNDYYGQYKNVPYKEISGIYNENTKEITLKFYDKTNPEKWVTWDINLIKIED